MSEIAAAGCACSHRGQLVEAGEQLVQRHDQLLGRALRGQAGETLNVCKQDAAGAGGGEEGRTGQQRDKCQHL